MGFFDFFNRKKKKAKDKDLLDTNDSKAEEFGLEETENTVDQESPEPITENAINGESRDSTTETVVTEEGENEEKETSEYIDFKVAGTSFRQKDIRKVIKIEKEKGYDFSFDIDEQYRGMKNSEILEDTFDEPIFQYENVFFSDVKLVIEDDNEHDPEAIAVYIHDIKVGYVPKKRFIQKKRYIRKLMLNGLKDNQTWEFLLKLRGGKYKVNNSDEVESRETDYKLDGLIIIKTENELVKEN